MNSIIDVERFNLRPFLGSKNSETLQPNAINIVGVCYDGSLSFRSGTRLGPSAIREASYGLETYSPALNKDTEDINFYDLGDMGEGPESYSSYQASFEKLLSDFGPQSRLLTLGGEHSISLFPISKYLKQYDDLVILHIDAHADLRDSYLGNPNSHACIMRRVTDRLGSNQELKQFGIRSGTRNEFDWMKSNETLIKDTQSFLAYIDAIPNSKPIYISLDLDVLDPSEFPGTGTPEPGGISFKDLQKTFGVLKSKNLVGADLVELSPSYDTSGCSSVMAAKVAREMILLF